MNKKITGIFTTSLLCATMLLPTNVGNMDVLRSAKNTEGELITNAYITGGYEGITPSAYNNGWQGNDNWLVVVHNKTYGSPLVVSNDPIPSVEGVTTYFSYKSPDEGSAWTKANSLDGFKNLPVKTNDYKVKKCYKKDRSPEVCTREDDFEVNKFRGNAFGTWSVNDWTVGDSHKIVFPTATFGKTEYQFYKKNDSDDYVEMTDYDQENPTNIPSEVGDYELKAWVSNTDNYNGVKSETKSFSITPVANPDWDTKLSVASSWTYTGKNALESGNLTLATAKNGGQVVHTYYKNPTSPEANGTEITLSETVNAGSYRVIATLNDSNGTKIDDDYVDFEVKQAKLEWDQELSIGEAWVEGEDPNITFAEINNNDVTVVHTYYEDDVSTSPISEPTANGTYYIEATATHSDTTNYEELKSGRKAFRINKLENSWKNAPESWVTGFTYDGENHADYIEIYGSSNVDFGTVEYAYYKQIDVINGAPVYGDKLTSAPTDAGDYKVVAFVKAGKNNGFDYAQIDISATYSIQQANNAWLDSEGPYDGDVVVSFDGWTYNKKQDNHKPSVNYLPQFGEVVFKYSIDGGNTYVETMPTNAGTYLVKAFVLGNDNFTGLSSLAKEFTIAKATPDAQDQTLMVKFKTKKSQIDSLLAKGYKLKGMPRFAPLTSTNTNHNAAELAGVGIYTFDGLYTHTTEDSDNYHTVNVRITVLVEALDISNSVDLSKLEELKDVDSLVVKHDGVILEEGKDYTVETIRGAQNKVEITFIGNYTGKITKNLKSESPATAPTETGNTGSTSNSSTTTGSGAVNAGDTTNSAGLMSLLLGMAGVVTFFTKKKLSK